MQTWQQVYAPIGDSLGLSALVALIPIVFFFLALAVFRMKGHYAAIITLALSMIVAIFGFEMPVNMVFASAEYGFVFGLWPIAWIIVASVFLYKLTVKSGQFDIMASVMIGGMVPPIAIALATTFFKNRFTKSEQQTTVTNYIMGLSFITEGAIPFAASDPLHVLPSCIIGSAIAGGMSMLFGCTLMAPHGGIFVFPVVGNAVMYLVSLVVGTVISAVLLGLLKKKVA